MSYQDFLVQIPLPKSLTSFAYFDGLHYLKIAHQGYLYNSHAFFPLYPFLIRYASMILELEPFLVGFGISILCFFGSTYLFQRFLKNIHMKRKVVWWSLVFFLLFPTSFFYKNLYTESLFLFLVLGSIVFAQKKKKSISTFCGFLAGITRPTGIFLVIPLFFTLLEEKTVSSWKTFLVENIFEFVRKPRKFLLLISPVLGFLVYAIYLYQTTGDPFRFFTEQPDFGANRSTSIVFLPQVIYRYIKIFVTAKPDFQYAIALLEFSSLFLAIGTLILDMKAIYSENTIHRFERIGINLFGWILLIVPTLTGTLSSVPRYILPIIPMYVCLASIKSVKVKIGITVGMIFLEILLMLYFFGGYFVG